jgi:hypothetical protein
MRIQKGIEQKKQQLETGRRKEAKESGIILERVAAKKKASRRDRGLGGPSVGRFKGGLLKLGRKDVQDLQGRRDKSLKRR